MRLFCTLLFLIALLQGTPSLIQAQVCDDCRYLSYQFDSVTVSTELFGQGVNADGQNQQLYMDIYEPYGDTVTNRPLIIFAFGGGFIQGSRTQDYVVSSCKRFAGAGYVAAAIDYRIGFSVPGLWPSPTEELMRVFFRAMQDMRGSVQWFRANADQGGNSYDIDPDRIYVGGASAGAITAVMMAYCDDSTEFAELGSLSAINQLGSFGSSSGMYPGYSWEPQGVFNIAGAIVNTDWMEPGDPPIISAHGDQDGTVPYQGGNIDFGFVSLGLEGSYNINERADSLGICSYLYTIVGGDHPSGNAPDTYFDEIYLRSLPRIHAWVNDRSFCCPLELDLQPDIVNLIYLADTLDLLLAVSNDSGNAQTFYCGSVCSPGSEFWNNDYLNNGLDNPYYLIGIATEGNCQATDFNYVELFIGIDPAASQGFHDYTLSPNPATNVLSIHLAPGVTGKTTTRLRDMRGAVMVEQTSSMHQIRLNTGNLARGIYFLEIRNDGRAGVQKIILE